MNDDIDGPSFSATPFRLVGGYFVTFLELAIP